jgi:pyruvate dehydrogenase E1 component beta subunit
LGTKSGVPLTVRGIINRGGEQGAQHSQALHSWYAHIPGLRVVMPATVADARDLLISSVLSDDPVLYIDDRWLYEMEDILPAVQERPLTDQRPALLRQGRDVTLVGAGYSTELCLKAADALLVRGVSASVIDLRVINPFCADEAAQSVESTGRLCVVDGGWRNCGLAGEVISAVMERVPLDAMLSNPVRITLPDAPAPVSSVLENMYYTSVDDVVTNVLRMT